MITLRQERVELFLRRETRDGGDDAGAVAQLRGLPGRRDGPDRVEAQVEAEAAALGIERDEQDARAVSRSATYATISPVPWRNQGTELTTEGPIFFS